MKKVGFFLAGMVAGGVISIITMSFAVEIKLQRFPEPDIKVIIDNEEWRGYNVSAAQPSPRCWVNQRGVLYEESGVQFPSWDEPLEREDDTGTSNRAAETALRRGNMHNVRRQACRCESANSL